MAPVEIPTVLLAAATTHSQNSTPVRCEAGEGPGDGERMLFEDPSAPDAEYQQWRREQLRQLELRYPEWHRNSYKDFVESFPHACRPMMAVKPPSRGVSPSRRLAGAAVFGK